MVEKSESSEESETSGNRRSLELWTSIYRWEILMSTSAASA